MSGPCLWSHPPKSSTTSTCSSVLSDTYEIALVVCLWRPIIDGIRLNPLHRGKHSVVQGTIEPLMARMGWDWTTPTSQRQTISEVRGTKSLWWPIWDGIRLCPLHRGKPYTWSKEPYILYNIEHSDSGWNVLLNIWRVSIHPRVICGSNQNTELVVNYLPAILCYQPKGLVTSVSYVCPNTLVSGQ